MDAQKSDYPMLFYTINLAAVESVEVAITKQGHIEFLVDGWTCDFIDEFILEYVLAAAGREPK